MVDPRTIEQLRVCVGVAETESVISPALEQKLLAFLDKLEKAKVKFQS